MRKSVNLVAASAVTVVLVSGSAFFTLTHVSANRHPGRGSVAGSDQPSAAVLVPLPVPPNCAFEPLSVPAPDPNGAVTAVLNQVPSDLAQSAQVEYPPCAAPSGSSGDVGNQSSVSFRVPSVTRYVGSAGTVDIGVEVPSTAAIQAGLQLGTADGSLSDGTALYGVQNASDASGPLNIVRWTTNGMVVTLSSASLSAADLADLASSVVLK